MYFGRGKNKVKDPYTFKHMYAEYIADKEEGSPYYVSYAAFVKLCSSFYKDLAAHIKTGGYYKMPYRMGNISVVKKKPKKFTFKSMTLNWKETARLGKQVFETNDHTSYFKFRFHWGKQDGIFSNKTKYRMVFTRANKRELAQFIKSGEYEYFEI